MEPGAPVDVKVFCGLLFANEEALREAKLQLTKQFGPADFESEFFTFDETSYYRAEMGSSLHRAFVSFQPLMDPAFLSHVKLATNQIEKGLAQGVSRTVNLDPGYMDFHKVILASAKAEGHKVYLCNGIYADPTLYYGKGSFKPNRVCFPDFKDGRYNQTFVRIRELYKAQLKKMYGGQEKKGLPPGQP
jgi:hypothetical protein